MNIGSSPSPFPESLLPKDWWRAPAVWWRNEPLAFGIFVGVNFFFGTLGIWLPIMNAALGGRASICTELIKLLESGGFYAYAIPFLAATVGVVFSSLAKEPSAHSRGTKILFISVAVVIFVVCALLLQIQVFGPDSSVRWINYALQIVVSVATVLIALYAHSIIQNEIGGSPQGDMEKNAALLNDRAGTALVSAKDFT